MWVAVSHHPCQPGDSWSVWDARDSVFNLGESRTKANWFSEVGGSSGTDQAWERASAAPRKQADNSRVSQAGKTPPHHIFRPNAWILTFSLVARGGYTRWGSEAVLDSESVVWEAWEVTQHAVSGRFIWRWFKKGGRRRWGEQERGVMVTRNSGGLDDLAYGQSYRFQGLCCVTKG